MTIRSFDFWFWGVNAFIWYAFVLKLIVPYYQIGVVIVTIPGEKKNSPLYSFPKAAVTEYRKPDDIKWQQFIVSRFWRLPSRKLECWQDPALWSLSLGRRLLAFFWLLVVAGNPCSVVALLQSLPPSSHCFLLFFLFLSLTRTSVMSFRAHLVNPA